MTEQIVGYEVAKLAEKKGFNITTGFQYLKVIRTQFLCEYDSPANAYYCPLLNAHITDYSESTIASTQSLLQKWLREVRNTHVSVDLNDAGNWDFVIIDTTTKLCLFNSINWDNMYSTYEQALEAGLLKALILN